MTKIYYRNAAAAVICFGNYLFLKKHLNSLSSLFFKTIFLSINNNNNNNNNHTDLTFDQSFEKVKFWVNELQTHEPKCIIILCGTKADLISDGSGQRGTPVDVVEEYANQINAPVFETSSKTGTNVENLFKYIAENASGSSQDAGMFLNCFIDFFFFPLNIFFKKKTLLIEVIAVKKRGEEEAKCCN